VQNIHIRGSEYSKKSEIVEWIKEDPMTINSLYTLWKFKSGAYKMPVYLEDVEVQLKAPWSVQVIVREKEVVGCVLAGNEYHLFDAEGLVLKKTDEFVKDVPVIDGMEVESANRFEYLKVKNKQIFTYVVSLAEEIDKNKLEPDRILWQEDSMDLFFADVCVKLGKTNYEEKLREIAPILEKLDGKKGILHLEHYTKGSTISFEENKE
jgi:cell division protein FtsQ